MYDSIRPGQVWLDTEGKRIQAHGGSILYIDGVYYFYGENKEKTDGSSMLWHWGVRAYKSTDLYNWEDCGLIIPPDLVNPDSTLSPFSKVDRPHIIYNARTKKYVAWLKIMRPDGVQDETVLTADNFLGPYTLVREGLRPLGMSAGDFDLVVAPDGKAYYYFERVHSETIIADLTDDYVAVPGEMRSVAREFGKEYLAVVHGRPKADSGTLRDLLGRDKARKMTFVADAPAKGVQEAVLDYRLLNTAEQMSRVRIRLHTGRTHQIRVQFSSRGMPLVGERKYCELNDPCEIALWSYRIAFTHPKTGEQMEFIHDPPDVYPWTVV